MDEAKEVLGAVFMVYSMASLLLVGSTRAARWGQITRKQVRRFGVESGAG